MTEDEEVIVFVHRVLHLRARKGLEDFAESCLVGDCWGVPLDPTPPWALELAAAGEPGSAWCPIISPELLSRESR